MEHGQCFTRRAFWRLLWREIFPHEPFFFLIAVTAVFFSHSPLFTLVRVNPAQPGSGEKFKQARTWVILYCSLAVLAGLPLLFQEQLWLLIPLGCALAGVLAYQTFLTSRRAEKSMVGELLAVISLTAAGPGTHYVIRQEWNEETTWLWMFSILYFISSIFYVKMIVSRAARKKDQSLAAWQCGVYHFALLLVLPAMIWWKGFLPLVLAGYIPIILRAFWHLAHPQRKLNLLRIGMTEIAYTVLFVVFVSLGFTSR